MNVAVVIPAFNAERYIAHAIQSVLDQTAPAVEVVVVDDGSTDGTARVAQGFGAAVRCIGQSNRGVSAARNRGARATGAPWIAFLDADDAWLAGKLARQRDAMSTGGAVCFTGLRVVYEASGAAEDTGVGDVDTDLSRLLFHRDPIPPGTSSTILVRRDVFEQVGGYDETLSTAADWDLLIRLRLVSDFRYVPEPLAVYRRHSSNMSRSAEVLEHDSNLVLAKAFDAPTLPEALRTLRRRCFAWNDLVLAGSYFAAGRWHRAASLALRAVWQDPALTPRAVGLPVRRLTRLVRRQPMVDARR